MALHLSRNHHQQLLDWAQQDETVELCGLLRGTGGHVASLERAHNIAGDPTRHFEIDPVVLIAAHKDIRAGGMPLIGYFHSHPNGRATPSQMDVERAAPDGRIWLIIAGAEMTAWQPVAIDGHVTGFSPVLLIVEG